MELSTAMGLATSAGLNAYIPLLAYGLLARYTDLVSLSGGWAWLADPVLLGVLGVLLLIELVADKIPAVDSVNDLIQTLIRPTSGGLMFASAFGADGAETLTDSSVFSEPKTWVLLVVGFAVALVMHLMKSTSRPLVNAGSAGVGAPVMSTAENVVAASLTGAAIFAPFLVLILLVVLVVPGVFFYMKLRKKAMVWRDNRRAKAASRAAQSGTRRWAVDFWKPNNAAPAALVQQAQPQFGQPQPGQPQFGQQQFGQQSFDWPHN